jgi:hypothetical protein
MNLFTAALTGLLVATVGIAGISAMVLVLSINEADAGGAWTWGVVFLLASLLAAFTFWRLM